MPGFLTYLKDFTFLSYYCFILILIFSIPDWSKLFFNWTQVAIIEEHEEFYSSVYCRGTNHTDRLCKFKNLCYNPVNDAFLFYHHFKSDIIGVPEDRFSPALADFSSVYDHNTQYFNFIDLSSSVFSVTNVNVVSGIAVLFKRFNPENLMHVFHDDLIPAFVTLEENFMLDKNLKIFFAFADGREPGPYADLYENFLKHQPIYLHEMSQQFCFENAIVGLNKHSLWYQYGFKKPQGPLNKDMNSIFPTLFKFRKYFKKQNQLHETPVSNTALLLTRGHNRKILNSKALAKTIELNTDLKTHITSLEEYSVIEVIEQILSCKLVVSMHGSLLILSVFLPLNSHIIELFPYGINPNICTPYKTIAQISGLKLTYHSWENKIEKNSLPHPEYPEDLGGIMHLPAHIQEYIKTSIVKPFLCCYNPEWLYRIYQDTIVDLDSFATVIKSVPLNSQTITNENDSFQKRLLPSEVQNISCHLTSKKYLNISWEIPWNVQFMKVATVEYELWYQDNDDADGDIKAFIMSKTFFSLQKNTTNVYLWIRCHVDGRIGPFNTDPFYCQK